MIKSGRIFFGTVVFFIVLAVIPLPKAGELRSSVYSALKNPIAFSRDGAQILLDLMRFEKNAKALRLLRAAQANPKPDDREIREVLIENGRLTRLLGISRILPAPPGRLIYARVIGRSPSAWNRVFLIDKGTEQGIHADKAVMSGQSLIGKIIEAGPLVSKVQLMTDPNSRIGVLIQRTRQQGVLYGTLSGECRIKYLSVELEIKNGDVVESAGSRGFFPKGLLVGKVLRSWKEPGQIYQVADVGPALDLSRVEEVACLV